ncbi:hypothetical protein OVA13_11360 [Pseudoxanthomonas sp. SL93]|uniref:hypothetical protein n=1 Tax=Pseudoxanthomonas sp. SL93 TaxID=2995142 RepID=UPI00226EAB10|nr:hypothetical protein [Pseudoxanthomonas sp. SL93]WAC62001.1 hypothetical protein OVA13_11360 [Pseudoxanthomonas sp. SL93]
MTHGTLIDPGYNLPTEAHAELQALRDHLHLLAQLSPPKPNIPKTCCCPAPAWPTASPTWPTPPTASSPR